eukprot:COSAG01_NODE_71438_length_256_cov_0.484076_1_plen_75_part_01
MEGVAEWKGSLKGWAIPAAARHRFKRGDVAFLSLRRACRWANERLKLKFNARTAVGSSKALRALHQGAPDTRRQH